MEHRSRVRPCVCIDDARDRGRRCESSVSSDFGFHFLEVTGKRVEDFSDMFKRNQVENYLRNQSFEEEVDNWVREIREDAFVEIRS